MGKEPTWVQPFYLSAAIESKPAVPVHRLTAQIHESGEREFLGTKTTFGISWNHA